MQISVVNRILNGSVFVCATSFRSQLGKEAGDFSLNFASFVWLYKDQPNPASIIGTAANFNKVDIKMYPLRQTKH